MKKLHSNLLLLTIIPIFLSFFSCSGKAGNDKSNSSIIEFIKPIARYQLVNNDTEYELISIEENYIGSFLVDSHYSDPDNDYGYLPITGIADEAFKDRFAIFYIVIADNITHIGRNAFSGWRAYQNICFQITEAQSKKGKYFFEEGWDANTDANIIWDAYAELRSA